MNISFNPVIDLGHILALLGLVAVIIGLLLQACSLSIAKKELNLKVENLSEIVTRIERETNGRKKLERKHEDLLVSHLDSTAESMNYSTYGLDHVQFVTYMDGQLMRDRLETLCKSLASLS